MADATSLSASQALLGTLAGLHCRALGGIAVALRCPLALSGPLERPYSDLDLLVTRKHASDCADVIEAAGFAPNKSFNRVNGQKRMLFDSDSGSHVDLFIGAFEMCHRLELGGRLLIEPQTLSLADLFLTKAQIAELTMKDVTDLAALLHDHELTSDDNGINRDYIARFLSRDWGWWRTVTANLAKLETLVSELHLSARATERIEARVPELRAAIDATAKNARWRLRARVGERLPWREEPETAMR